MNWTKFELVLSCFLFHTHPSVLIPMVMTYGIRVNVFITDFFLFCNLFVLDLTMLVLFSLLFASSLTNLLAFCFLGMNAYVPYL